MQTRKVIVAVVAVVLAVGVAQAAGSTDSFGTGDNQFQIDFVPISGAIVNHDYRMGKFEITNNQWDKFEANYGTVTGNAGVPGYPNIGYSLSSTYTGANVPNNNVSWLEAAQFVNWLNTSTGHTAAYKFTGTIHTSDYTFSAWVSSDSGYNANNPFRNSNAFYYLPTENEFVKAAYWNGTTLQTYSNASASDLVSGSPDPAKWNYLSSGRNSPWVVGSGIQELNGTYDMMGNVFEWIEDPYAGWLRKLRGGCWLNDFSTLAASDWHYNRPDSEDYALGFRVASVPEPATLSLLALGGLAMLRKCRRRR